MLARHGSVKEQPHRAWLRCTIHRKQVRKRHLDGLTASLRRFAARSSVSPDAAPLALRLLSILAVVATVAGPGALQTYAVSFASRICRRTMGVRRARGQGRCDGAGVDFDACWSNGRVK